MSALAVTPRGRIVAALEGRRPDRVPWAPQLTRTFFLGVAEYADRFRDPALPGPIDDHLVEDELAWRVAWYRARGAAFVDWLPPGAWGRQERCRRTERLVGNRLLVELVTPIGTLDAELVASGESGSFHPVKLLVRGPDDLRVYTRAVQDRVFDDRHDEVRRRLAIIGDAGVALVNGPSAPLQKLLLGDLGIEGSLLALADHPREMAALTAAMHEAGLAQCRLLAASPARVVVTGNVTGTGMLSPALYREHVAPYVAEYAAILRAAGKLPVSHASGEPVAPIAAAVRATGVAGVHGLDLAADEAAALAAAWGGGVDRAAAPRGPADDGPRARGPAAWGGLSPAFLARATPDEAARAAAAVIARVGDSLPLVLGSSDDCVAGTPPAVIEAVARAAGEAS
jgi:hypothetical protein